MFPISAHLIFGGHLSYSYYLLLEKLEQTKPTIYARYKQKKKNMRAFRQAPS